MQVIADALVAKRQGCPRCGARANTACSEPGKQYMTLAETHVERLALVNERYTREDPRIDAEG